MKKSPTRLRWTYATRRSPRLRGLVVASTGPDQGLKGPHHQAWPRRVISSRRGSVPAGPVVRGAGNSCPACGSGRRSGCLWHVVSRSPPSVRSPSPKRCRVRAEPGGVVVVDLVRASVGHGPASTRPAVRRAGTGRQAARPVCRLAPGIGRSAGNGAEGAALMMREASSADAASRPTCEVCDA